MLFEGTPSSGGFKRKPAGQLTSLETGLPEKDSHTATKDFCVVSPSLGLGFGRKTRRRASGQEVSLLKVWSAKGSTCHVGLFERTSINSN